MRKNEEDRALLVYWAQQLVRACERHHVYVGPPLDYIDQSERIKETLAKVNEAVVAMEVADDVPDDAPDDAPAEQVN